MNTQQTHELLFLITTLKATLSEMECVVPPETTPASSPPPPGPPPPPQEPTDCADCSDFCTIT
jgi:hypothetical protein